MTAQAGSAAETGIALIVGPVNASDTPRMLAVGCNVAGPENHRAVRPAEHERIGEDRAGPCATCRDSSGHLIGFAVQWWPEKVMTCR